MTDATENTLQLSEVSDATDNTLQLSEVSDATENTLCFCKVSFSKIEVAVGDKVDEGDSLVILSAMKMENEIKSSISGIISKIHIKEEELVRDGQLLIAIKEGE